MQYRFPTVNSKTFAEEKIYRVNLLQSELITFTDRIVYRDEYKNTVAVITFGYGELDKYYINPKLYSMGQEQQKHIENVYGQVREPRTVLFLNEVKNFELK